MILLFLQILLLLDKDIFEITEYGVLAVNTTKGIFMKGTDNRIFDEIYLSEGSYIKINSQDNDPTKGILIVMSIGRNLNEWERIFIKTW